MNARRMFSRALVAVVALFLVAGIAFGQGGNVNLGGSGGTLSGTFNIKGNINTSSATGVYTYTGTVNLTGTGAATQTIASGGGTSTLKALVFTDLNAGPGASAKDIVQGGIVSVNGAFVLNTVGKSYAVGANTLNFGGTVTKTAGTFDASDGSSVVNYTKTSGSQTIFASTYGGTLGLTGGATKQTGGITSAVTVTHATGGGALSILDNFTVSGSGGTLRRISVGNEAALTYSGTGTLTLDTLTGNLGEIISSSTGTLAFTYNPVNGDTIKTATGALTFNGDINNTGGKILVTGAGNLNINKSFTSTGAVGTLTLNSGSTTTYTSNSAQILASATYGTLNMAGTGIKTASNDVTIATAFSNGTATTNMSTYSLLGAGTKTQAAGGTMQFGGATNGVIFAAGTVEYNGASQTITGHASDTYSILVLSGTGTKSVLTGAGGTVHTTGNLTVSDLITLDVAGSGVVQVDGDLNINGSGTITNAGTITVGN